MWQQLEMLRRQQLLADLDLHFARLMARLAGADSPELVLGACLVSRHRGSGHVCFNLYSQAGRPLIESADLAEPLLAPEARTWIAALRATPVVGWPGEFRPLILDGKGRLYLYRYWQYERQLAEDLLARAANGPDDVDEKRLRAGLERLFPAGTATDWQKVAAEVAALKSLCVISGGPGTGKTTTVVRILALLGEQSERPLRIGLTAPTGKAAARLQEAVRLIKQHLPLKAGVRQAIPEEACTIHRLLGARADSVYFHHNRDNPLPLDVLVVDEASMVDLALMAKLVQALPQQARLILLGDKDQLASVEAGAVLGDICGDATGFSAPFRERLEALTGESLPDAPVTGAPLQDCIVLLRQSFRFGADSGIGSLARIVNRGEGQAARALWQTDRLAGVAWRTLDGNADLRRRLGGAVEAGYRLFLESVRVRARPEQVFDAFNRFRVLCAHRRGPAGAEALNRLIVEHLQSRRLINARQTWYPGRPILITRNDYNLRLFNGDVGITLPDPDSDARLRVFFQASDGSLRRFPPSRLPEHETVYAMTIHKSQGSEFDRVLLVLALEASQAMTRELIYTGVTRARQAVEVWGNPEVFEAAVERNVQRSSGLREALWDRDANPIAD